jgi:hypothetical protein
VVLAVLRVIVWLTCIHDRRRRAAGHSGYFVTAVAGVVAIAAVASSPPEVAIATAAAVTEDFA